MTALIAWPNFHVGDGRKVDNQVAAPAETRTPNLHRAKKIAHQRVRMEGWRQRGLGAKEEEERPKSRATAPFPSWRNGDRAVLAVKGSLRRKERALDRSGPL